MDNWHADNTQDDWQTVGKEPPRPPSAPEAPDNLPGTPGWLWALAVLSLLACLGGGLLGIGGLALVKPSGGGTALLLVCGGALALVGIGLGVYTLPMLLAALNVANRRGRG